MDSKRLSILLALLLLVMCFLMDKEEAFELRPPRSKRRRCVRRMKKCSRRRIKKGKKADAIKPLDMNHVSTILVGEQCYKFQKSLKSLSFQRTYRIKQTKDRIILNYLRTSFLYTCGQMFFVICYLLPLYP